MTPSTDLVISFLGHARQRQQQWLIDTKSSIYNDK